MAKKSARKEQAALSAREVALRRLERIEEEGAFVGLVASEDTDAREQRQAREYVAGVTRWQRWLDFLLAHFYRGDFSSMEPRLRHILRLGLYDLLFLDTPPHAALNETVELAKRHVRRGAGGLVNGLLRSLLRQKDDLPQPQTGDDARDLAIRHSHPTWLVRRWLERFGPGETEALLGWNNARPLYGLRRNPLRLSLEAFHRLLDEHGVAWEASPYLEDFVRVPRLQAVVRAGWLREGAVAVQDESAGLVVRLLDARPGETVVDACAAPGGKALYAAERMENNGHLLAFDVHAGRLRLLDRAAEAHGLAIVRTEAADLRALAARPEASRADRVLLDAPCSGLGVLAKRADLRWNRTPEELEELATLQAELLAAAARLVRPGGLLVYATCSIAPEENEAQIVAFLAANPDFSLEPAQGFVPEAMVTPEGYFATLPHRHQVDGAFGARLRRVE